MSSSERHRDSEGAPAPSAPHARASGADAPSEDGIDAGGHGHTQPEEGREAAASVDDRQSDEHEQQLERDLDELAAKAQKADEYLELAQRTRADFENYRKRAARETAAAQERGIAKLARELLPAVDNLDRALAAARAGSGGGELVSGIELVHADVLTALARVGIEPYSPEGEQFDPEWHEAVAQQPCEGAEPGTVVEVYQRGYRLGDSVLRPARVLVAG